MAHVIAFPLFLEQVSAEGGFPTDDVLRTVIPLLEKVHAIHEIGKVAPLEGVNHLGVDESGALSFDLKEIKDPKIKFFGVIRPESASHGEGVEVVSEQSQILDLSEEQIEVKQEELSEAQALVKIPKYLPGYASWEQVAGQHDPVSDIFSLGLILASVACGLDLTNEDDFQIFVNHRTSLFSVNSRLNPVVASVIVQMTELHRSRRAQDLPSLIRRLKNYREQPTEYDLDYQRIEGFGESNLTGKRRLIQRHMRDRLFEISRRNRLLYFRPNDQQINLTVASTPVLLDFRNIRHEDLFVWHDHLADLLVRQAAIPLNRFVRFEDAPYVAELLDKVISEARRDRAEYGFAQLKLVICFLRWNNLKEAPSERIVSPLLLLPVTLTKKKGIRDSFTLQAASQLAEVNPVLRHHLHQLYNFDLPEHIDLGETTLDKFHEYLSARITASEQAISLQKINKPQIEIIHKKAQQRLDQYRRRQKLSVRSVKYAKLQHSYRRENLKPLGLQMFLQKVRVAGSPFAGVLSETTIRQMPQFMSAGGTADGLVSGKMLEKERLSYSLKGPEDQNPYCWGFDLCNITLGNFNYRKMSLVSDYNRLVDIDLPNPVFDRIFSLQPKALPKSGQGIPFPGELFTVVPCDPTQAGAIALARLGESFIIQGPPGTGKSQTITNLIADYIAHGKRVLFVCEKRAAIDVVYHRLGQQGLQELCCLIHDSQTDKKEFIQGVSGTYAKFLSAPPELVKIREERDETVRQIEQHLNMLARFEEAMSQTPESVGMPVRRLLERLVELRTHLTKISDEDEDTLPGYRDWRESGRLLGDLAAELKELGEDPSWSTHVLRWLNPAIFQQDRPVELIRQKLSLTQPTLDRIESVIRTLPGLSENLATPGQFSNLVDVGARLKVLADRQQFELLNPRSALSMELNLLVRELEEKKTEWDKAIRGAEAWKIKLSPEDCRLALSQAEVSEKKLLPWVAPNYWKLRRILNRHYDFNRHSIRRSWTLALRELQTEYQAQEAYQAKYGKALKDFGVDDLDDFISYVQQMRGLCSEGTPEVKRIVTLLENSPPAAAELSELLQVSAEFTSARSELDSFLVEYQGVPWGQLRQTLLELQAELPLLRELGSVLAELKSVPETLLSAFRNLPLTVEQLEGAIGRKSLHSIYRGNRYFSRFEGRILREKMGQLQIFYETLQSQNGKLIAAQQQQRFLNNVNISNLPASQLTSEQKLFKKTYATGRRELEHEFGKTMRYRSIRELAAGPSGKVLSDLKPVWLMSPLSVSDTLPLDSDYFDVVIFDEASQIPVEDAVPALYRANQSIVVGDEMQLPPSKFFASNREEDETLVFDEEDERIEISLEADSFLTQSALNLPSTMLGWHYRSRSEALIGYSNAAFYRGELLTIPDRNLPQMSQTEIVVQSGDQGEAFVERLLERSLSFHFHPDGIYEDRRNRSEAMYIAQLVRGLLMRRTGKSLGIVAFSEAQQTEIESALHRLGQEDPGFRELYEIELEREEEDQFCGLFIKNLENVQGDERDIILLSVCYGYDRNRRMLMNFGPINQRGGEKRLNVIFSRAKEHMAIVSSIRYSDIKNEYNDGANNLRLFLQYAETFSRGEWDSSRRILSNLNPLAKKALSRPEHRDIVTEQVALGLRERGWIVDLGVGQSRFQCDLAIRDSDRPRYALGIFVDSESRVGSSSLLERTVFQPRVLQGFGWQFTHVLTKDWFHDPSAVLDRLERHCRTPDLEVAPRQVETVETKTLDLTPSPLEELLETSEEMGKVELIPSMEASSPVKDVPQESGQHAEDTVKIQEISPDQMIDGRVYRFELRDSKSEKFWEITLSQKEFTTQFGKVGSTGQSQTKNWPNERLCKNSAARLIREKLRKGYLEI